MKTKKWLIVVCLVSLLVTAVTPLVAQQENPPRTPQTEPNDANSPQPSPSPSPSPTPSYTPQGDSAARDYDVTRADTGMSWGIPIVTLLIGLGIGYLIGRSRPPATVSDIRRDRDRVA